MNSKFYSKPKPKVMKKILLLLFVSFGFLIAATAQQKTITGAVTSAEDNLPVIGATVQIKGTTLGTATDLDGRYQLDVSVGDILEFRYVGMRTQEVVVGASNVVNIVLEYEQIGIDSFKISEHYCPVIS